MIQLTWWNKLIIKKVTSSFPNTELFPEFLKKEVNRGTFNCTLGKYGNERTVTRGKVNTRANGQKRRLIQNERN